jgi:hypothetical protein
MIDGSRDDDTIDVSCLVGVGMKRDEVVKQTRKEIGTMQYSWTKAGPCRIHKEDAARVQITLPGRKRSQWVSRTQLLPFPGNIRLVKQVGFDQECGCTAVIDIRAGRRAAKVRTYNVYGSMKQYTASGVTEGLKVSPHYRRKALKEKGFVRATGSSLRALKEPEKYVYQKLSNDYKVLV